MARNKGTFLNSANYEPLIAAPFDARDKVDYKHDLIAEATWSQKNGAKYIYNGMTVRVCKDLPLFNGLYFLQDAANFNSYDSWIKLANEKQIEELQTQIDTLKESDSSVVKQRLDGYIKTNDERVNTIEQLLGKPAEAGVLATGLHLTVDKLEKVIVGIGGENEPATVLDAITAATYKLPIATAAALGGIVSAIDIINDTIVQIATNKIYVNPTTGIGEVRQISTDILVNGEAELILCGGYAN